MRSLQGLGYDALHCLADCLDAENFLSLCLTCKALNEDVLEQFLSNLALCEKTLKACGRLVIRVS